MPKTFLVVGSAHLDVIARATNPESNHKDRVGTLTIDIGGTGGNVAINLARHLQSHAKQEGGNTPKGCVRFLATMNDSIYSHIIVDHLRGAGIDVIVTHMEGMPLNGFSAHLDATGELVTAITASPLEIAGINRNEFLEAIDGVDALILDCNLSESDIKFVAQHGKDRGLPIYVALTSDAKCTRLRAASGLFTHAFMNKLEYRALADNLIGRMDPNVMPPDLARIMNATLVVAYDKDGVLIATPDGKAVMQQPQESIFPAIATRLGMGDALMASTIYHSEIEGIPLDVSISLAMRDAAVVGQSEHALPGDRGTIERMITRFRHQAERDALTGLANRRFINERLPIVAEEMIESDQGLCIMMIDIDHFKSINDTWGHDEGDRVIKGVAAVLHKHMRESDLLGRWGGEEFIAAMPGIKDMALAGAIARRICRAVANETIGKRKITISVGYALLSAITKTPLASAAVEQLIQYADEALYKAKKIGRNRAVAHIPTREAGTLNV